MYILYTVHTRACAWHGETIRRLFGKQYCGNNTTAATGFLQWLGDILLFRIYLFGCHIYIYIWHPLTKPPVPMIRWDDDWVKIDPAGKKKIITARVTLIIIILLYARLSLYDVQRRMTILSPHDVIDNINTYMMYCVVYWIFEIRNIVR